MPSGIFWRSLIKSLYLNVHRNLPAFKERWGVPALVAWRQLTFLNSCDPLASKPCLIWKKVLSIHLRAFLCKVPMCCFSVQPVTRFVIFVSRAIRCETSISFCNHVIVTDAMWCPKVVSRADAVTLTVSETPCSKRVPYLCRKAILSSACGLGQ